MQIMQEETIIFGLDNAKTPKEERAAYKNVEDAKERYAEAFKCKVFSTSNLS